MKANPSPNLQLAEEKITKGRNLQLVEEKITKGRKKRQIRKKEEKKHPLFDSLYLDLKKKKKHSFQLAYSSIGVGNRFSVFTDLHQEEFALLITVE